MTEQIFILERDALWLVWTGVAITLAMACAVVVQRLWLAIGAARRRHLERRYGPFLEPALDGDDAATRVLVSCPPAHRIPIARLLLMPLVANRDRSRIAATRAIVNAMSLRQVVTKLLRSRWWWRRTLGLQVVGLMQATEHTTAAIAALSDPNTDVRNAALDALADMQDPTALPAIVAHLHDTSLARGRRIAALAAFGSQSEMLLLDSPALDPEHRILYARALGVCGSARSRSTLCDWTADARPDVRVSAFEALGHVGLDERAAALAIAALESQDSAVRAMAASALHGWTGPGDAPASLARHLDDRWPVAVRAARSLQSMDGAGRVALEACATRRDPAGELARQMLWMTEAQP